jgi:hypothetical protein
VSVISAIVYAVLKFEFVSVMEMASYERESPSDHSEKDRYKALRNAQNHHHHRRRR